MKQISEKIRRVTRSILTVCFVFSMTLLGASSAMAQQRQISGVVYDANGPMVGVAVTLKGAATGVTTGVDGRYTISVPQGSTLNFSFMGYNPVDVAVGTQTTIDVQMEESSEIIDEVVVVGYGTVRKRDLTGAVVSVKSDDIVLAPTSNVMEALAGRVAGMDISTSSGKIGSNPTVLLRGSRSIYGSNTPLYIIDGIPGSYTSINPSDVESVDVLKDASSTAIYGSAGANGVVIVSTKKGKAGKATVNFDTYFGFSGEPAYSHGMIGDEWTTYQREAYKFVNGQYPAAMSSVITDASHLDAYNDGKWIDWVNEAAGRTATVQHYNMSVSSGNAGTRVFASLNYEREEGLLRNEDRDRYIARLNLDQDIFPWATFGLNTNVTYAITNNGVNNTFTRSLSAFPLGDAYDENGVLNFQYAANQNTPLGDFIPMQYVDENRATNFVGNAYLEVRPLKGLSFRTIISASLSDSRTGQYWGAECTAGRPTYAGTPHAEVRNNYGYGYTWDNILSYTNTFAEDHNVGVTLVSSWNKSQSEMNLAGGSGQTLDAWSFYRLLGATSQRIESNYVQSQKMSFAARVNYSYKGKYLFTASLREDGVSWFSSGHKWDYFPAVAVGWRIYDEKFMEPTYHWLSNLKLRAGYGVTGNSGNQGAYGTTSNAQAYSSAGITIDGKIVPFTQSFQTYGNPGLGWEKSSSTNIGLELGFIDQRITLDAEWFKTKTTDLLFSRKMPITAGASGWGSPLSSWENIAETSGHGLEFTLNTRNFIKPNFTWNTSLTFAWSKDKIDALPDGDLLGESLFIGQPLRVIYGYKYAGIWGTDISDADKTTYNVKPGYVKIQTIEKNGDGGRHIYGESDRMILGHQAPDYVFGLNNSFTFRNFDLSVFALARYGHVINSGLLGWYSGSSSYLTNQIAGADYWTETNQGAYFPIPGIAGKQTVLSALRVRDGSFIKVKNITLGYTIPNAITRKAMIQKVRIYGTMYNPFIYVKDKQLRGTDPEMGGSDSFPLYKQYVFGLNITF